MKDYTKFVSPFQGNGEIDLPEPSFPAKNWHFIKALSGNTTPHAALPFGKYTCGPYSGGYPGGCGVNKLNCGEPIRRLYETNKFIGLAHFCQSGTGAIGVYYCYALTSPYYGDFPSFEPRELTLETAEPGFYRAEIDGISSEATVSGLAVVQRHSFAHEGGKIAIDFANDGLYEPYLRGVASGRVTKISPHELLAEMKLSKITLWFAVSCEGEVESFFRGNEFISGDSAELGESENVERRFGAIIDASKGGEVRLAVSAKSANHARELLSAEMRSFDEIRSEASELWNRALSMVEIETEDAREREIFYSNLYHTLIKPCDLSGEAFLFDEPDGDFVTDLATMWDIYKTQLPFLFSFYPGISRKLLKTLERFGEKYKYYPHCLLLSGRLDIESRQARMLAEYAIVDAYLRGIDGNYVKLLELSKLDAARFTDYAEGKCEFASHILDMGEAFAALELLAKRLGRDSDAAEFRELADKVWACYDSDGMMRAESKYYEGNRYNYSFRPMSDMKTRLETVGRDLLEREALRFFGFTDDSNFGSRFEGFNNETDMETPYFLHEIGRRDLLAEVIKSGLDSMFTTGIGGIPGNADSGGLTACYLWMALGLFPISGQDRIILTAPRFSRATLHLSGGDLTVERIGDGIDVESASLNGREITGFELTVADFMRGGKLEIFTK